ncbi:glycosyltransferase family A protein [Alteromonas sp. 1_MG-2023]|uniref:glycosyltransferase family 2 protein n=1 Tax=Alteromonas sp. 1_MG-2023 TaxID=3062669 RepID=UPI0026E17224|nr:glycosyltransferase family A protein [Alteromonas sp. 1_MG-2023]MDO6566331.1 glycosyltransferase family A protein [Alteromonas sp. 1_MG-2023]
MTPLVSIILPTFNRAHFLEQAFHSLRAQEYTLYEVIIVDDGSTDNTKEVVASLSSTLSQTVRYIYQNNQGPGVARQNGIDKASGEVVAFFDSDDEWLPEHLLAGVEVLQNFPECDWVYFACKRVEKSKQCTLLDSTFYNNSQQNKLFSIAELRADNVYQLNSKKASIMQLQDGIDSGLQNSLVRKTIFEKISIPPFRIGEDRLLILMAIKNGFNLFFKDKVTVIYNVHDGNTSDTATGDDRFERRIKSMEQLLSSYEATKDYILLNSAETDALNKRLAEDYFWKLGYSLFWESGNKKKARMCYRKALKFSDYRDFKMLKSYVLSFLK